jgi:radical SAM protein with 4Fe4S-binding SPASM domain
MVYHYNGDIYTCDEGRTIGEDIFKLGNVKSIDYKGVLGSKKTCSIVAASTNDTHWCDTCVWKPWCGLCPVCDYAEQGSIIPKLPMTSRCKIFYAMFEYVFDKILNDPETKDTFLKWVGKDENFLNVES